MIKNIILASQSPRRKELLEQINVDFICIPSDADEVITSNNPDEVVKELSRIKATDIADKKDADLIIGADTIVASEGMILGKPKSYHDAFNMIKGLQGRKHQVYTGVTLILKDKELCFSVKTEVFVYPMTDNQIIDYLAVGEHTDKAGAYGIQGYFARYIEKIEGDYNNVVGLPISAIIHELENIGVEI